RGDGHDLVHFGRATGQVDGDDRPSLRGDGPFERGRVQVVVVADVGQDRGSAEHRGAAGARDERVGGRDDLVARSDADRTQRQHQRVGTRVDADGETGAAQLGELPLEL